MIMESPVDCFIEVDMESIERFYNEKELRQRLHVFTV